MCKFIENFLKKLFAIYNHHYFILDFNAQKCITKYMLPVWEKTIESIFKLECLTLDYNYIFLPINAKRYHIKLLNFTSNIVDALYVDG